MTYRGLICMVAVLTLAGCSATTASGASGSGAATTSAESGTTSNSGAASSPNTLSAPPLEGSPAAERVIYAEGDFRIARSDGSVVTWSLEERAATSTADPARQGGVVLAWSPRGTLAIVSGAPPVVVRLEDSKEVLRFVKVEQVETAGFFPDGSGLYVGEPSGKLHVWNESEHTLTTVPTENLESFMARQSPSFSANFSSLSGRATVTGSNELLLGTQSGKLYWWNPTDPTNVKTLVKLGGPIRDTAYSGGRIYATTEGGEFRAANASDRTFLSWTSDVRADFVATAASTPGRILVADDASVRLLSVEDGHAIWSRSLGSGSSVCGVALSDDGEAGAICVDGAVIILDAKSGAPIDQLP